MSVIRLVVLFVAIVCVWSSAQGHDGEHAPARVTPKQQYQPTPIPDRIVLTWSGDPTNSQDVSWRTDLSIEQGLVEYAIAESGPEFVNRAVRKQATSNQFKNDLCTCRVHSVQMNDLEPKTKYAYRVGDGTNWSEWFHFSTASEDAEPFTFVYFGDAQNNIRQFWSRVIREAHSDAPKARFIIHAGDLVNSANSDGEWGEWFGAGGWLNAMIPSIATPGNHEYFKRLGGRQLTSHWRTQFSFPTNGPKGLEESTYWLDYQGVRIVSLNSNVRQKEQVEWVDSVLADNPNRWTVVTFHHPIFSSSKGRDNDSIRKLWKPLFDKHRVDLVLQGHDHSYARTGLEVPDNLDVGANVKSGSTVYVVSVSGTKAYTNEARSFFVKSSTGSQLYQILHVDEDTISYEAKTANGTPHDSFTLQRRADGSNELIESEVPAIRH